MGKIFYIMGKSASGKDRIYSLLAAHKELNLKTLILYTTRPIRAGEQDGKNYYFVDDGKLEEFRKNGNLIEERAYHTVYGIWTYFTADDGQVNLADSDYLGIGTLESFKKMRKYYVEVAVSRQFLAWIISLGEGVTLVGPDNVVEMMNIEIDRLIKQYKK